MFSHKLPYDCLIPAAGLSSRMGKWKLTIPISENFSLLENSVKTALAVCKRVIVVGGYRFGELMELLSAYNGLILVENPDYESGMLSSIQHGLNAVESDFFITPADMPGIGEEHYRKLSRFFGGDRIVRPVYEQKPGHPILCPYRYKEKILALKGERLFTEFRTWDQQQIPWKDSSAVTDIDTREDLDLWYRKGVRIND